MFPIVITGPAVSTNGHGSNQGNTFAVQICRERAPSRSARPGTGRSPFPTGLAAVTHKANELNHAHKRQRKTKFLEVVVQGRAECSTLTLGERENASIAVVRQQDLQRSDHGGMQGRLAILHGRTQELDPLPSPRGSAANRRTRPGCPPPDWQTRWPAREGRTGG